MNKNRLKQELNKFLPCKLISVYLQVDLARRGETPSPQPKPAEEPMEASQPEPSDLEEPEKDVEADVTVPEAGSSSEDVEWPLTTDALKLK